MIALAVAALFSPLAPVPGHASNRAETPCTASLCDADRLTSFFDRLAKAHDGGAPVRILQIGDSHTAGDQITGAWRTALQTRYGIGGRGMMPPGRPYPGYLTRGVTAGQSPGWTVSGIFGPSYSSTSTTPLGISGYSLTTTTPGASLSLTADTPNQAFDRFVLCGWAEPGAGSVQVTLGTTSEHWSLAAAEAGPQCHTVDAPAPAGSAEVRVLNGPVTLTSWMVERRDGGGVELSNLGVVGAQLVHLERENTRLAKAELAVAHPDLIVIAFGTNEAFKPGFSAADYDADLTRGVRRIQRLAPGVPILLVGAPDSATSLPELQRGADGRVSTCPDQAKWAPPAALETVETLQRRRAHELGVAYWDWAARMGGRCTANRWATANPPLMHGARVHFTRAGADVIARLLQEDLDAAAADARGETHP